MRVDLFTFVSSLLLGAAVVGCDAVNDYIPMTNGKTAAREHERRSQEREAAAEREQTDGERTALRQHIGAHCRILESRLSACKQKIAEAKTDRETLGARIRELSSATDENGRTPERNAVLSNLLSDDKVNALAAKYMDYDFRMIRLEYIEAMRTANGDVRRRNEALSRNQADYEKSLADSGSDTDQARLSERKSAADIQRAIAALEREEKELKRSISMSSAVRTVRDLKERELRDVSDRLRRLKLEYDEVRTSRGSNRAISEVARQANAARENAQRQKERADDRVVRLFAGIRDPKEITSECEARTIGALSKRILAAERDPSGGDIAADIEYLKSLLGGLDRMNLTALQRVRSDVDARLAKKPGSR